MEATPEGPPEGTLTLCLSCRDGGIRTHGLGVPKAAGVNRDGPVRTNTPGGTLPLLPRIQQTVA